MNELVIAIAIIVVITLILVAALYNLRFKKNRQITSDTGHIGKDGERSSDYQEAASLLTNSSTHGESQPQANLIPDKLLLGDEDNPWGEIIRYDGIVSQLEELALSQDILVKFGPLFQQAPSLATNVLNGSTKSYVLKYSKEIRQGLQAGIFHPMKASEGGIRGVVLDSKNIIRGHGSLHKLNGLRLASAITGAWQILAIATAQKFLADINKQLERLNKNVKEIKELLGQQEQGNLEGSLAYLNSIRNSLNSHELPETELATFRNQVETIELQTQQIIRSLKKQLDSKLKELGEIKLKKSLVVFTPGKGKIAELNRPAEEYHRLATYYLVALSVRGLAAQELCALLGSREVAIDRLEEIRGQLEEWRKGQEEVYNLINSKLPELKKGIGKNKTEKQNRFISLARLGQFNSDEAYEQLDSLISTTITKLKTEDALEFVVELDEENNPVKVSRLLAAVTGEAR